MRCSPFDPAWTLTVWLLMSLAAFRVTRFVTSDSIIDRQRSWILGSVHPKLGELLTCPWCIGAWLSGATVALTDWQTSVPLVALQVPAVSAAVGLLARLDSDG